MQRLPQMLSFACLASGVGSGVALQRLATRFRGPRGLSPDCLRLSSAAETASPQNVLTAARFSLENKEQLLEHIERSLPEAYTAVSPLQKASVGQHMRHSLQVSPEGLCGLGCFGAAELCGLSLLRCFTLLQHFAALLTSEAGAIVKYDERIRGNAVETDVSEARSFIRELLDSLDSLGPADLDRSVLVRFMLNSDMLEHDFPSTLERELFFVVHHSVHHDATISAILKEQSFPVPDTFGRAPSTAAFDKAIAS